MALKGRLYIAGPYGADTVEGIRRHFEELLGESVALTVKEDDRLIGGFRALVGGRLYDASVAARVGQMLRHLKIEGQG